MKPRTLKSKYGVALMLALAFGMAAFQTGAPGARAEKPGTKGEAQSQAGRLEGTWRVQVTRRNCQTGAELQPATPALLSFAKGGTLTETTTTFPPTVRGPGHGFWRHAGGQTYTAVTEAFLFNPSAPPASAWVGTQRITQTIEFGDDPDVFHVNASVEFFGPSGGPVPGFPPQGCATAVARRMQ